MLGYQPHIYKTQKTFVSRFLQTSKGGKTVKQKYFTKPTSVFLKCCQTKERPKECPKRRSGVPSKTSQSNDDNGGDKTYKDDYNRSVSND